MLSTLDSFKVLSSNCKEDNLYPFWGTIFARKARACCEHQSLFFQNEEEKEKCRNKIETSSFILCNPFAAAMLSISSKICWLWEGSTDRSSSARKMRIFRWISQAKLLTPTCPSLLMDVTTGGLVVLQKIVCFFPSNIWRYFLKRSAWPGVGGPSTGHLHELRSQASAALPVPFHHGLQGQRIVPTNGQALLNSYAIWLLIGEDAMNLRQQLSHFLNRRKQILPNSLPHEIIICRFRR